MDWTLTADAPAGNVIVDDLDDATARIRQDQRGSTEPWFYWRFAVRGAQGRTIRFEFTDWDVIGSRGPCVSRDGGRSWDWLGRDDDQAPTFTYRFAADESDVQFCFCLPYLQSDLDAFLAAHGAGIQRDVLCRSREGREVELLAIGPADSERRLLLTARHHACESSASFVLEGVLDAIAHAVPGAPEAWVREHVRLLAVPFVDKDGVEDGDQGKARDGHDHNRDYVDTPRYRETAAVMRLANDGPGPDAAVDLHSPWIRGPNNEHIYQVGSPRADIWRAQQEFGRVLEQRSRGALPYSQADDLPWGQSWNTSQATPEACSFSKWMANRASFVTSLEIPYANVGDVTVSPDLLRDFGRRLAGAIGVFMRQRSG